MIFQENVLTAIFFPPTKQNPDIALVGLSKTVKLSNSLSKNEQILSKNSVGIGGFPTFVNDLVTNLAFNRIFIRQFHRSKRILKKPHHYNSFYRNSFGKNTKYFSNFDIFQKLRYFPDYTRFVCMRTHGASNKWPGRVRFF